MDYLGPPRNHGGSGNLPIKRIVIHCTVGAEPGVSGAARGIAKYFRTTSRNASAHIAVDSREAVRCAWDSIVCFHAPPNDGSLGYELCCSLNNEGQGHWQDADHQAMLRIAAREVAADCKEHDIPIRKLSPADLRAGREGICGHIDVSNAWGQTSHWDPGPYFPWAQFIALVQEAANPTPESPEEDDMQLTDSVNVKGEAAGAVLGLDSISVDGALGYAAAAFVLVQRLAERVAAMGVRIEELNAAELARDLGEGEGDHASRVRIEALFRAVFTAQGATDADIDEVLVKVAEVLAKLNEEPAA